MDKNKSIDGLVSRRTKVATTKKTSPKKTVAKSANLPTTTKHSTKSSTKKHTVTNTKKTTKSQITVQNADSIPNQEEIAQAVEAKSEAEINTDFLKPTQVFDFDSDSGELHASESKDDNSQKVPAKPKKLKKEKTDKPQKEETPKVKKDVEKEKPSKPQKEEKQGKTSLFDKIRTTVENIMDEDKNESIK